MKTAAINVESIKEQIVKTYQPEKVILFGSHARGESDEWSDIDLLIVKRTNLPFLQRSKEFPDLPVRADVFIYTPEEFERMKNEGNIFIENALKDGTVLYSK